MKTLLCLIHRLAIACAVLMMGFSAFESLQLNGFNWLETNALLRSGQFIIGLVLGVLVLWKSAYYKDTSLNTIIIVHLVWSFVFVVFFFNQYRIIPELHGFEPGDYRREYLKGVAMLIVSFVLWIGLFSIGPILKAWDNRHESRATGSVGDEPAEAVERPEDKFRAGP